jgi:hypothetical protein
MDDNFRRHFIRAFTGRRLAKLGIDENMAGRIRGEFQKHGEVVDGWHIGNFENGMISMSLEFFSPPC